MSILYKRIKEFNLLELKELFLSVGWNSGNYPEKLQISLKNLHSVFSAWDEEKLVGLISCLSDGIITVYLNNLLVKPEYQGNGIGTKLVNMVIEEYKNYEKKLLIAENTAVGFYAKLGFREGNDVTPMRLQK